MLMMMMKKEEATWWYTTNFRARNSRKTEHLLDDRTPFLSNAK